MYLLQMSYKPCNRKCCKACKSNNLNQVQRFHLNTVKDSEKPKKKNVFNKLVIGLKNAINTCSCSIFRDQTIYTQKFRGIFSVGKHRNSVGCVGIIFRRPPIFFTTLSVFIRFWCFLPFWNQETKPITLEINSRQLG